MQQRQLPNIKPKLKKPVLAPVTLGSIDSTGLASSKTKSYDEDKENWDPTSMDFENPDLMKRSKKLTRKAKTTQKLQENQDENLKGTSTPNAFLTNVHLQKRIKHEMIVENEDELAMSNSGDAFKTQIKELLSEKDDLEDVRNLLANVESGLDHFRTDLLETNQNCLRVQNDLQAVNLPNWKKTLEDNEKLLKKKNQDLSLSFDFQC